MNASVTDKWRFTIYVLLVVALTIAQLLTQGAYFRYLTLYGAIVGYGAGLGMERRRYDLESEWSMSRWISRASLYTLPLAFSGSLLVLSKLPGGLGTFAAVFMLITQVIVTVYIGKTLFRGD